MPERVAEFLMCLNYIQLLTPIIGLTINVLVQILSFRYISNIRLLKSVFLGFAIGFLSGFVLGFYVSFTLSTTAKDSIAIFITNLIVYSALGYCYFHFLNLGETARRIRILREIHDSKEGLSMDEILEKYNAKEIVERRINRLINNNQVIYKEGRYYVGSPIMILIAKIIVTMKLILLGKKSKFE